MSLHIRRIGSKLFESSLVYSIVKMCPETDIQLFAIKKKFVMQIFTDFNDL